MKQLLTTFLLLSFRVSFAQNISFPAINNYGDSITDFIPKGWQLIDSTSGDLNNDNKIDFAFVIQQIDSIKIIEKDNNISETYFHPRILLIAIEDKKQKLKLIEESNSFIIPHDNPAMEDPFQSIKIENGIIKIDFQLFYNAGSWYVTNTAFNFRYQNNDFVLISAEHNLFHRVTHDFEEYSFNFLSKKLSIKTGNENSEKDAKTEWKNLDIQELKTIKTFKKPYTWEVIKNIYL